MSILSYAQNFEDVMLWRALGHITNGFYIDIGAQHPIIDSVSKAFYENGWRGIHVEATPAYAALVREDRPDELVLQVAISENSGTLNFYEIPDTGLSTGDESIAEHHRSRGYKVVKTELPCITLADVFTHAGNREIHWLKIDVEGMEGQVLAGWGNYPIRPWVLVVESTYPNSQVKTHDSWEGKILALGYLLAYFDGLSRYYVLAERHDLIQKFDAPPNVFDGFSLALSVPCNGHARALIEEQDKKYKNDIQNERAKSFQDQKLLSETLAKREYSLEQTISHLHHQQAGLEKIILSQSEQVKNEIEVLLRARVEREQQVEAQFLAIQQQVEKEKVELASNLTNTHKQALEEIARQYTTQLHAAGIKEQELIEKIRQNQQEIQLAKIEHAAAVKSLERDSANAIARWEDATQQIKSMRSEQRLLEREQRDLQRSLTEAHNQALREVHQQYSEQLFNYGVRERELMERFLQAQHQAHQAKVEHVTSLRELERSMVRTIAQRENEFRQLNLAAKKEAKRRELAWAEKEKTFNRQITHAIEKAHNDKVSWLQFQMEREQAATAQLLEYREQAAQEKLEQARLHIEQQRSLQREYIERQQIFMQDLLSSKQALISLENEWTHKEKSLLKEISKLENDNQVLQKAKQLLEENHDVELNSKLTENFNLREACAALESELKAEVLLRQQSNLQLSQSLAELQQHLASTHASLSWRMTAPLRILAAFVFPEKFSPVALVAEAADPPISNKKSSPLTQVHPACLPKSHSCAARNDPHPSVSKEMDMSASADLSQGTVSLSTNVQHAFIEALMPSTVQVNQPTFPAPATTLNELLAYHDQQFIHCAYQTILGREPDHQGFAYYLDRLRNGYSKLQIVMQLRLSDEGKAQAAPLPELDLEIQRQKKYKYPLIGRLLSLLSGVEGNSTTERKLRAIENQIHQLGIESNNRFEKINANLANVYKISAEIKSTLEKITTKGGVNYSTSESEDSTPINKPSTAEDIHIDKLMQRVFEELKRKK